MVHDGLVFYDKDEKIIFNQYSFCELVKWDIVKFADISYEQASRLVIDSSLVKKVENADDLYFLTHEITYHWAMLLVYGDMYWTKGIPYPESCSNEEYTNWKREISQQYKLKDICEFCTK